MQAIVLGSGPKSTSFHFVEKMTTIFSAVARLIDGGNSVPDFRGDLDHRLKLITLQGNRSLTTAFLYHSAPSILMNKLCTKKSSCTSKGERGTIMIVVTSE